MDVSVRASRQAVRTSPVLRVFETSRLVLHEEVDAARVDRLSAALRREGVLRNPPVAVSVGDGTAVVLDGANRVTALGALDVPHAVVQLVDYAGPDVTLSTWRHYVRGPGAPGRPRLRERAAALSRGAPVRATLDANGDAQAAADRAAALVLDSDGAVVLGGGVALPEIASLLRRLVGLYRDESDFYRVESGDLAALEADYGPGTLVVFHQFSKDAVLQLAASADRLPAGVTRHLIQGRALRLNTPIPWLSAPGDSGSKQAELDAVVQRRYLEHGVRHYSESTVLFDE
jgi:hypothetical protein